MPNKANRLVSIDRLNDIGKGYYNLGDTDAREAVILFNTDKIKTPDPAIEYFI